MQAPKLQRPTVGSQESKRGKASSVTSTMSFPGISWKELQEEKKKEMIQLPKLWVYGSRAVQDSIRKCANRRILEGLCGAVLSTGVWQGLRLLRFSQNAEDPRRLQAPSGLKNRQRENQEAACPTHDLT